MDLSPEMISSAKKQEEADHLGITYVQADCAQDLMKIPEIAAAAPFDMVSAVWLLEYAKDLPTITKMVQNMHNLLKPGGIVCTVAENTNMTLEEAIALQRYGMRFPDTTGPILEGAYDYKEKRDAAYAVAAYIEIPSVKPCILEYYSWTLETVEQIYRKVGFSKFVLHKKMTCAAENEYEAEFYKAYTDAPDMLLTQAIK